MANKCKYYKLIRQVSYNSGQTWSNVDPPQYQQGDLYELHSADCPTGDTPTPTGTTIYRWVELDPSIEGNYYCNGIVKYHKEQKQVSYDNGVTWSNVVPAEYQMGSEIGVSTDCNYVPPSPTSGTYLTFVVVEPSSFSYKGAKTDEGNIMRRNYIQYSLDSGNTWSIPQNEVTTEVLPIGSKIMWKGDTSLYDGTTPLGYDNGIGTFSSTSYFNVEGSIMSLVYGDDYVNKTIPNYSSYFFALFENCTKLVSAKNLVLPSNTRYRCYLDMFFGCSSLIEVPTLPATTLEIDCYANMFSECSNLATVPNNYLHSTSLAIRCYFGMFAHCTSLTTAPSLPATSLANGCYEFMFMDCTSLTTAPVLPAPIICAEDCYDYMFYGCSKLNYVKCLGTNGNICEVDMTDWLSGVSRTGTFVKLNTTQWEAGEYGVPINWTIENA